MDPTTEPGRDVMMQRRLRAYELALDTARRDAVQAAQTLAKLSARIAELELELARAREEPAKFEARLAEQQRARRAAEQRAHAERAHREELQIELAMLERERDRARDSLQQATRAGGRERELEAEVARLHRLADESEQAIVANRAARERAERHVLELTEQVEELTEQARPLERLATVLAELRAELETLRGLVERESAAREHAEQRVAELEHELRDQGPRASTTVDAIDNLRTELASLTGPFRAAAVSRAPAPSGTDGAAPIEPGRFESALKRLRTAPVEEALAEPAVDVAAAERDAPDGELQEVDGTAAWIGPALRRIGAPETVGRLMLGLLVAQRTVHPDPIAYDIHLTGMPCLQLTIGEDGQGLVSADERRAADEVRFAITGEPSSFGRLVLAGRLRRRFGRGLATVHGDRAGRRAFDAILGARLTLAQLRRLGLRIDPGLTLELAAAMIEPGWTRGSSFTLAYGAPATDPAACGQELPGLIVADGLRVVVSSIAAPDTVLSCDPDDLPALLAGDTAADCEVLGAREPLDQIRGWLSRAQSAERELR